MDTSVSSSDNSGFSGDSTTSWDQLALQEVMMAEENLHFERWQEILKEWKREIIENEVRELRNVENILKHLENVGKDCSMLNLSEFTVENILEVWGEKFLKEFTSIMRNGNQILRGIKRKVKGSLVKGNKMKKSKREEGVSGRSSTNRMAGDVKQALEKVMEDIISLDLGGNIMERMDSLDLNQGENEQGEARSNHLWRKEDERKEAGGLIRPEHVPLPSTSSEGSGLGGEETQDAHIVLESAMTPEKEELNISFKVSGSLSADGRGNEEDGSLFTICSTVEDSQKVPKSSESKSNEIRWR